MYKQFLFISKPGDGHFLNFCIF